MVELNSKGFALESRPLWAVEDLFRASISHCPAPTPLCRFTGATTTMLCLRHVTENNRYLLRCDAHALNIISSSINRLHRCLRGIP